MVQFTWTVPVAAVGGLAWKATLSTVKIELLLMVLLLSVPMVPVKLAATPLPKLVLQSLWTASRGAGL